MTDDTDTLLADTVAATRELVHTLRVADAPAEALERASALVREAAGLLAPHRVGGTRAQNSLHFDTGGGRPLVGHDVAAFFPYSPVIGALNAVAPPLAVTFDGERLRGRVALAATYTGPPGGVHGGVIALLFDELLGCVAICHGLGAFTGTLSIRYERFTPVEQELEMEAWIERTEGRKVFVAGTIGAAGAVTARAEGIFIRSAA